MEIYLIRQKSTTLYLRGTPLYHSFTTFNSARIFSTLGKLKSFLTASTNYSKLKFDLVEICIYNLADPVLKDPSEVMSSKTLMKLLLK